MADRTVKVNLQANITQYEQAVERAEEKTEELRREAERFDGKRYRATADVNTQGDAKLKKLKTDLERFDGRKYEAKVNVSVGRSPSQVGMMASALVLLGPAALSSAAIAGGAIGGMTTVLGVSAAAAGSAALAFSGIGDAVSAVNAYQLEPTAENLEKMNEAMGKLTIAGQNFTRTVVSLRPELDKLKATAQNGLLPGAEAGLRSLTGILPNVNNLVARTSEALGELAAKGGAALNDPFWKSYFDFLANEARPTLIGLGATLGNFAKGFAGLQIAFAPVARDMISGLRDMSSEFADWSTTLDTNQGFQEFISYVRENGPLLMSTLGSVAEAVGALVEAAMPVGPVVLTAIKGLAEATTALMGTDAGPWIVGLAAAIGTLNLALKAVNAVKLSALGMALAGIATGGRNAAAGATAAAGGASRASGALSALGGRAGAAGLAIAGLAIGYEAMNRSQDEAVAGLTQTGGAAAAYRIEMERASQGQRDAVATLGPLVGGFLNWKNELINGTTSVEQHDAALQAHLATLTPVEAATTRAAVAQADYDAAVVRFGQNSPQAIAALGALRDRQSEVEVQTQLANKSGQEYFNTLQNIVAGGGQLGAAAERIVAGMRSTDLATMGATVRVNEFGQVVATLPNGKEVVISANVAQASTDIRGWIETTNLLQANPTVQPDLGPANTGVAEWDAFTRSLYPMPNVGANTAPGIPPVVGLHNLANTPQPGPSVGSDPSPGLFGVDGLHAHANTGQPGPVVGANPGPGRAQVDGLHQHANTAQRGPDVSANTSPGRGIVSGFLSWVGGLSTTITITAVLRRLFGAGDVTSGIQRRVHMPMANGGLLDPRWNTIANAPGNRLTPYNRKYNGKALRTMPNTGARMVNPNTWRIVGDRMDVAELYAPLDGSGRSLSLIAEGARTFGKSLVDTAALERMTGKSAAPASIPRSVESQARAISTANNITKSVTNNVTVNNPIAERASDSVQSRLSRLSDLGLFAGAE